MFGFVISSFLKHTPDILTFITFQHKQIYHPCQWWPLVKKKKKWHVRLRCHHFIHNLI